MKELTYFLVSNLVENKDAIKLTEEVTGSHIHLILEVAPDDIGKVIGKGGRIAKAIRTVLKASATKENVKVTLEIL